jgi:predicted nucleotide-binding protein
VARINPKLLERIEDRLGVSQSQVYKKIEAKAAHLLVTRDVAAVAVAVDAGINVNRGGLATDVQLAAIREATRSGPPAPIQITPSSTKSAAPRSGGTRKRRSTRTARRTTTRTAVMVVHGRDVVARDEMYTFLRTLGLRPTEWSSAMKKTQSATPYVGQVLDKLFEGAAAVLVLITPDDEARLKKRFRRPSDPTFEHKLTGQPRPNVLFEAGRAFGSHPRSTVVVQVGPVRKFSDTEGLHIVHLSDTPQCRKDIAERLGTAGCDVDMTGDDWLTKGDFSKLLRSTDRKTTAVKKR